MAKENLLSQIIQSVVNSLAKKTEVRKSEHVESVIFGEYTENGRTYTQTAAGILNKMPHQAQQTYVRRDVTRAAFDYIIEKELTFNNREETADIDICNIGSPNILSGAPPIEVSFKSEPIDSPRREVVIEINLQGQPRKIKGAVGLAETTNGRDVFEVAPGWHVSIPGLEEIGRRLAANEAFFDEINPSEIIKR